MAVYEGNENYIFISYAHKNTRAVMKVVDELMNRGYRVWYDEGIAPGSEWPENIAQHLDRSAAVIAFVTSDSMASVNCRREIHFALSRNKPFLSVFLEKTELPLGMELQLAAQQNVLRYNYRTEQEFIEKICSCEHLQPCLMPKEIPAPPEMPETLETLDTPETTVQGEPVSVPQPEPEIASKPALHFGKRWLVLASVGLAAAVLGFVIGGKMPSAETAEPAAVTAEASTELPTTFAAEAPTETSAPRPPAVMRKATPYTGNSTTGFWGQSVYKRYQVATVQFQSTLEGVPASAWDVSEAADRSVLAWMDGVNLHVAADGRIILSNASCLFESFVNLRTIDWGDCIDTSAVTDMSGMFAHCEALTSLDLSGFDTSAVTDMSAMFLCCIALTDLDVSGFDTSAVTNMNGMFAHCEALTSLDLSGFDTSAVTNMNEMFGCCYALTSLDVSGFDTSAVTDMGGMFDNCEALTSLDLSGFDTSAVTDMTWMFGCCYALTSLDVSGFDTSAVTDMTWMFGCCYALTSLDVSGFNISAVTDMEDMFERCTKLPKSSIPQWYKGKI